VHPIAAHLESLLSRAGGERAKPTLPPGRDDAAANASQKARGDCGADVDGVALEPRRRFTEAERLRVLKAAKSAIEL